MLTKYCRWIVALLLSCSSVAVAQSAADDQYTRYELLAPESSSFRIVYDITAVTPGARYFFNPIRKGSEASDESVWDRSTGRALEFEEVGGREARQAGYGDADPEMRYIQVHLPRPVPEGGESRIRIVKTYRDPASYFRDGETIVFDRPLGIRRNTVVLPSGYELVSVNVPSQVVEESDGRIAVSFVNPYPVAAPLVVRAKPLPPRDPSSSPPPASSSATSTASDAATRTIEEPTLSDTAFPERAAQTREIVYFLQQPETHSFRLYHDYTESEEGVDRYVNVVRAGSTVSDPSARNLDSGEALSTEILGGEAAREAGVLEAGDEADTVVVVIRFPAVEAGHTTRIRIEETYTDAGRYGLLGERLVWRRSFGRVSNDVVLPPGWYLTASSIPGTVREEPDGRVRISLVNPRPDLIDVLLTGRRR